MFLNIKINCHQIYLEKLSKMLTIIRPRPKNVRQTFQKRTYTYDISFY